MVWLLIVIGLLAAGRIVGRGTGGFLKTNRSGADVRQERVVETDFLDILALRLESHDPRAVLEADGSPSNHAIEFSVPANIGRVLSRIVIWYIPPDATDRAIAERRALKHLPTVSTSAGDVYYKWKLRQTILGPDGRYNPGQASFGPREVLALAKDLTDAVASLRAEKATHVGLGFERRLASERAHLMLQEFGGDVQVWYGLKSKKDKVMGVRLSLPEALNLIETLQSMSTVVCEMVRARVDGVAQS